MMLREGCKPADIRCLRVAFAPGTRGICTGSSFFVGWTEADA